MMDTFKCGILTIHDIPNYGATFQAYGLLKFLNEYSSSVKAEIINYHMNPSSSKKADRTNETNGITYYLKKARNIKRFLGIRKRERRFKEFQAEHYSLSTQKYNGDDEILNDIPQYDVYISGSDQLFNLQLTNRSLAFFLPGFSNYKISYSTSFGMNGINSNDIELIVKYLGEYDGVSVRELSAQKILIKNGIETVVTADPVFLLNKQHWISLEESIRTPKKYIFCYLMSENPNIYETLNWIRTFDDIPVIVLHTFKGKLHVKCKYLDYCSPGQLLYLIRNASYVLTNSFHGCALSVIYGKKVFCLEEKNYIGDQRFAAMFKYAKIEGKVVPYDTNWKHFNFNDHLIDGNRASEDMKTWIDDSKNYLSNHIERAMLKK